MKKLLLGIMVLFLFSGCATVQTSEEVQTEIVPSISVEEQKVSLTKDSPVEPSEVEALVAVADIPPLEEVETPEELIDPEIPVMGVVFAKTDFKGVLETTFVRLKITNRVDPEKVYRLHIGEKADEQNFPWEVTNVKPGYFFIELPEGDYTVDEITIPVGNTFAVEKADFGFTVLPEKINYLGTLHLVGTKERIKLGGVPVIQPGFEYEAAVIDQREEGLPIFHQRYPHVNLDVSYGLMKVYPLQ